MREDIETLETMLKLIDEDAAELIEQAKELTGSDTNRLTAIKKRLEELKNVAIMVCKQLDMLKTETLSIN